MDINLLKNQWEYVLKVDPFVTYEDIEDIVEIDDWDLLIVFKDGRKIIYDRFTNYFRGSQPYKGELTDEEEIYEFKHNLRSIMSRKKISQEELAELVGISQTMVSHYVNGRSMPSALILRKITKVLDCSMDDFFYKEY